MDKYNTIQYNTIQYNTVQYSTVQYSTVQYNTIQYNTIQYNTIQYNTMQYKKQGRDTNSFSGFFILLTESYSNASLVSIVGRDGALVESTLSTYGLRVRIPL